MSNGSHKLGSRIRYQHVDKVYTDLKKLGYNEDDPVDVEDLFKLDQWHYNGTAPADAAIAQLEIRKGAKVLDIGAGIGGIARYLVHKTDCHVTANDLLPGNHRVGCDLTRRCGMDNNVTHMCGDIMDTDFDEEQFDHIIIVGVILHIEDKLGLFRKLHKILKHGGSMFFEDFYLRKDAESDDERSALKSFLLCVDELPKLGEFKDLLEESGFQVEIEDITAPYADYTYKRWASWTSEREEYVETYGEEAAEGWIEHSTSVKQLFNDWRVVGGARFVSEKPSA